MGVKEEWRGSFGYTWTLSSRYGGANTSGRRRLRPLLLLLRVGLPAENGRQGFYSLEHQNKGAPSTLVHRSYIQRLTDLPLYLVGESRP